MNQRDRRLRSAHVHVGGCGRIGSAVVLALHAAGVGTISCNDPQDFDEEQLGHFVFSRRSDIGRPKVHVLEKFLDGRPGLQFLPVAAPNQALAVMPFLEAAQVIVSCPNQLDARLYFERLAVQRRKPIVQASARDARISLGGVVTSWHPDGKGACFGCLATFRDEYRRGEILIPSVTTLIATIAAERAIAYCRERSRDPKAANVFAIDLTAHSFEPLHVLRRMTCNVCGPDIPPSEWPARQSFSRQKRYTAG